jgi:gmma-aminobutyric acid receptor subunit gamma/cGMP-dependent protein kinase 2
MDDAIAIALHTAVSHLDKRNTYVRTLTIYYSSTFNTILPSKLINKHVLPGLYSALRNWVLDFLMGRPHVVKIGNNTSHMLILKMRPHKGLCQCRLGEDATAEQSRASAD